MPSREISLLLFASIGFDRCFEEPRDDEPEATMEDIAPLVDTIGAPSSEPADEPSRVERAEVPLPAWATRSSRIAAGRDKTCALDEHDRVVCWGTDPLGRPEDTWARQQIPPTVVESARMKSLAGSGSATCGLASDHTVHCWGDAESGLHDGPLTHGTVAPIDEARRYLQLSAGPHGTCGVTDEGELRCWGIPCTGCRPSMTPFPVSGAVRVVSGSSSTGCALDRTGGAWCWNWGKTPDTHSTPLRVADLPKSLDIALGDGFACALGADGRVRCWGSNAQRKLGAPRELKSSSTPRVVPGVTKVVQLVAGHSHVCAREDGGVLWCWGDSYQGKLGRETKQDQSGLPRRVRALPPVVDVAAGYHHTCAMTADHTVYCWGQDGQGAVGLASSKTSPDPTPRDELVRTAKMLDISDGLACALTERGEVACWDSWSDWPFQMIGRIENASTVAVQSAGGCALVEGTTWCWGSAKARAGHELPDDMLAEQIDLPPLTALAGNTDHTCGIDLEGAVWCWGMPASDESGPLEPYGPLRVPLLRDVVELSMAFGEWACARRRDGTVACWERSNVERNPVPTDVRGVDSAISIGVGNIDACALSDTGKLLCWTKAAYQARRRRLPTSERPVEVSVGLEHGCVRLDSGRVACWGENYAGQLGTSGPDARPGVVRGLKQVNKLFTNVDSTCARKNDGSLFCWGEETSAARSTPAETRTPARITLPTTSAKASR